MVVGALAAVFYAYMGFAMAGAYRIVNPLRVIRALVVCLPTYLLVLAYLIPVALLVTLLAWGLMILVGMLGIIVVGLAPETFGQHDDRPAPVHGRSSRGWKRDGLSAFTPSLWRTSRTSPSTTAHTSGSKSIRKWIV